GGGDKFCPRRNLHFFTSDEWDVHALQAGMRSGIARLFASLYSTKMRGGYLRFQAQYFRRIRLPRWKDVSEVMRERLKGLSEASDRHELNEIVASLYGFRSTR
ncbi:MAG: modification methylase PaeR7I, partial [Roseovarius sp.]|nr:modification methylase PaeR7I [Roseovarius sp.]